MIRALGAAAALLVAVSLPAAAGGYKTVDWAVDLKPRIYGERPIEASDGAIDLEAPYRASDDRRVPVDVAVTLADGSLIRSVALIIDENPMPVSAQFDLAEPVPAARFGADMRFNGPSPLRAVVETVDGRLLMVERLVKTSGLGACAAPPIGNPEEAIAKIGGMEAAMVGPAVSQAGVKPMVELGMSHPQHTGMQMDQITLHYILARYIATVEVSSDGTPLFTLTGSISLSEDPAVRFEVPDTSHMRVHVRMEDTSETVVERDLALFPEG